MIKVIYLPHWSDQEFWNPVLYFSLDSKNDIIILRELFLRLHSSEMTLEINESHIEYQLYNIKNIVLSSIKGWNIILRNIDNIIFESRLDKKYWSIHEQKMESLLSWQTLGRSMVYIDELDNLSSFIEDATIEIVYENLDTWERLINK